jgi:putative transcriptional regulator
MAVRKKLMEFRNGNSRPRIARDIGITPQMLGAIERGERNPSLGLAKRIADYYGTTVDDIFFSHSRHKSSLKNNKAKEAI